MSQHSNTLAPGRPAVEGSSKQTQRPFKVKDPRYGIAGEGRAEEEASIAGNDAFRAFLFLGAFPLVGLATLVFFNDDLRAQYLERWAQDTGKNQLSQQAQMRVWKKRATCAHEGYS